MLAILSRCPWECDARTRSKSVTDSPVPNDTEHRLPAEMTRADLMRFRRYAAEQGITVNEAIVRLAEQSRQMSQLGRSLGITDFECSRRGHFE